MLSPADLKSAHIDDALRQRMESDVSAFRLGFELIIGTFADSQQALLYHVPECPRVGQEDGSFTMEYVRHSVIDSFAVIGTGAYNAQFWLMFRGHSGSCSPKRAAYRAFEAHRMAAYSPFVNEEIEMVIATHADHVWLTERRPTIGSWSLNDFMEMY